MTCRAVRDWLHREAGALDETQRLVLEDHLAACARCRVDRAHLRMLREAGAALPVPPACAREYSRAIARALLEDGGREVAREGRGRRWAWPALAGAAAIGAVVGGLAWLRAGEEPPRARPAVAMPADPPGPVREEPGPAPSVPGRPSAQPDPPADPPAAVRADPPAPGAGPGEPGRVRPGGSAPSPSGQVAVVEDGALVHDGGTLGRGDAVPPDVVLRATRRAGVRIASSHVVIAASSAMRWSPAGRILRLERGALDIRGPGVARVITERFELELDGADASVEPARVQIHRGAARAIDRAGAVARVAAGSAWSPPDDTASAVALLARARAQLAARDLAEAERTAGAVQSLPVSRGDLAEAQMVLAEAAQARGALDLAVARYTDVARAFADTPAAESALYAAARIEIARSRGPAARVLLDRYLDRYPAGRYAAEVQHARDALP